MPVLLLISACAPDAPAPSTEPALYAGEGRDRLCLAGSRAGMIAYGAADTNCSIKGRAEEAGEGLLIIKPDGDEDCRIEARSNGNSITLRSLSPACDYYCGPNALLKGKAFNRNPAASPAVDFAGDPLCG